MECKNYLIFFDIKISQKVKFVFIFSCKVHLKKHKIQLFIFFKAKCWIFYNNFNVDISKFLWYYFILQLSNKCVMSALQVVIPYFKNLYKTLIMTCECFVMHFCTKHQFKVRIWKCQQKPEDWFCSWQKNIVAKAL